MAKKKAPIGGSQRPPHWGGTPDVEVLDDTPIAMPLGSCRPTPLNELIAHFVRREIESERGEEYETFEESEDFEDENDELLDLSAYELAVLKPEGIPDATISPQTDESPPERVTPSPPRTEPQEGSGEP